MKSRKRTEPNQSSRRRQTIRIVVVSGLVASGVVTFLLLGQATAPKKGPTRPIVDAVQPATTTSTTMAPLRSTTTTTTANDHDASTY